MQLDATAGQVFANLDGMGRWRAELRTAARTESGVRPTANRLDQLSGTRLPPQSMPELDHWRIRSPGDRA
jgi:hypothetical protein